MNNTKTLNENNSQEKLLEELIKILNKYYENYHTKYLHTSKCHETNKCEEERYRIFSRQDHEKEIYELIKNRFPEFHNIYNLPDGTPMKTSRVYLTFNNPIELSITFYNTEEKTFNLGDIKKLIDKENDSIKSFSELYELLENNFGGNSE